MSARPGRSPGRIFAWPALLGLASLVGLVSALIGDGGYDLLSWLLLGGVALLTLRHLLRRSMGPNA